VLENVGISYCRLVYFTSIWYTYVMVIWNIVLTFGMYGPIWYIFPRFGTLYQDKSGNPVILARFLLL
jgi:hypothetical protein